MKFRLFIIIISMLISACANNQNTQTSTTPTHPQPPETVVPATAVKDAPFGQTIYVPIYSHIYYGNNKSVINLAATLSVRNTDLNNAIIVTAVRYYDSDGKMIRQYLNQPIQLSPMASRDYMVEVDDTSGGVGANFIVEWVAQTAVSDPVVEAVMVTTQASQGISFLSTGRVIKEIKK